ncbi:serine palmitoyltransferase small subunit B [Drosophila subobscura]|uniref:serine palmitoyltransferase small subunit B n=1 Tax=Drosophila subobscura TaxID=7241 RepID=UPI00155A1678|nr:serine palmitoyltransferase small subunit B [Drosophila subobscura]
MFQKLAEDYEKLKRYVKWLYVLYELNTQIAICEPWEKVFCHVLLGSCLSLLLYASYAFVPGYFLTLIKLLWPASDVLSHAHPCNINSDVVCGNESDAFLT